MQRKKRRLHPHAADKIIFITSAFNDLNNFPLLISEGFFILNFPESYGIIAILAHTLYAGGDHMKLSTLMGFGVGMATTLIAAKAVSSGEVKSKGKAIRKKIVSMLD